MFSESLKLVNNYSFSILANVMLMNIYIYIKLYLKFCKLINCHLLISKFFSTCYLTILIIFIGGSEFNKFCENSYPLTGMDVMVGLFDQPAPSPALTEPAREYWLITEPTLKKTGLERLFF